MNMLITLQEAANYSSSTHSNESDSTASNALTVGCKANSTIWQKIAYLYEVVIIINCKLLFIFRYDKLFDVDKSMVWLENIIF